MTAEHLERLLVVQEHDLALDRLRHRREILPERAELASATRQLATLESLRSDVAERRDKVRAEEKRLDDEAEALGARAADEDRKLYSGTVTSPRELQAMQAEIEMLKRHRRDLEDRELEVMEQREALDTQISSGDAEHERLTSDIERLGATIAATETEIAEAETVEGTARAEAAAGIPEALLRNYERRRAQNRGAGAARLVGTTCQACHLTIPSTEAERIRRAGGEEVAYCDNCSAILVP